MPEIRGYIPLTGQQCYAVTGPSGHYLVTPGRFGSFDVWKSDSLITTPRPSLRSALALAAARAGIELHEIGPLINEHTG